MGTLIGHVAPGFGFFLIGLWHLLNNTKLHAKHPNSYTTLPWFPTSKLRYLELFLILLGSSLSIAMELFISPKNHQPFDTKDGTIPSNHLHNFEHSSISLTFFIYAAFAILLDHHHHQNHHMVHNLRQHSKKETLQYGVTQLLGALAFGQELLLFNLHSTDHMGVEGQYHLLLQIIVLVSFSTALLGIGYPNSFLVSFVRSLSILFQGVWFMVMGFMLWTPEFIPKGCFMNLEDGHRVVRCKGEEALHRAKSLVNIQFSWYLIGLAVFAASFYLFMLKKHDDGRETEKVVVEYSSLTLKEQEDEVDDDHLEEDIESQKESKFGESKSFIDHMGKAFTPIEMER